MSEKDQYEIYSDESRLLAEVGAIALKMDIPRVELRLPRSLADRALEAWERDEEGDLGSESCEQERLRGDAAVWALIGLAIESEARSEGDYVITKIDPTLLGRAIDASDALSPEEVKAIQQAHCE